MIKGNKSSTYNFKEVHLNSTLIEIVAKLHGRMQKGEGVGIAPPGKSQVVSLEKLVRIPHRDAIGPTF